MVNFYVTYTLKDKSDRDAFYRETAELSVAEKSRQEEGCLRYAYYFPADSENQIFLWEQWESRQAQKKHTEQPHFKALSEAKARYTMETEVCIEE